MMYIPIELYSSSEYETADVYTMSQQQGLIKAIHVCMRIFELFPVIMQRSILLFTILTYTVPAIVAGYSPICIPIWKVKNCLSFIL